MLMSRVLTGGTKQRLKPKLVHNAGERNQQTNLDWQEGEKDQEKSAKLWRDMYGCVVSQIVLN